MTVTDNEIPNPHTAAVLVLAMEKNTSLKINDNITLFNNHYDNDSCNTTVTTMVINRVLMYSYTLILSTSQLQKPNPR
jgi:hypothetical protein